MSPGRSAGRQHLLDPGHEDRAVHRAVGDVGGEEAAAGQAADEGRGLPVAVRHRPVDPLAARAAAVAPGHVGGAPVSSTNTSRAGFSGACPARQSARCWATSGRSCSCGPDATFFQRQPEPGQRPVHQAQARRHAVGRQQPGPQLVQGDVRTAATSALMRLVLRRQLELLVVALRPGLGLAGRRRRPSAL